jgi:hypothetical protein
MRQYIINLVHRGQMIGPQSTLAGDTTFGAPNKKTFHSQPFPSGILHFPLVALTRARDDGDDRDVGLPFIAAAEWRRMGDEA